MKIENKGNFIYSKKHGINFRFVKRSPGFESYVRDDLASMNYWSCWLTDKAAYSKVIRALT